MSTIPPNWLGSIIQTQGAKAAAAQEKDKQSSAAAERTSEGAFANRLQNVIDETDQDSSVYSDAEGQGSRGRAPSDGPDEESPPTEDPRDDATDPDAGGLDLQA
jgi:hypothetical protein